jgi:hypothetical protein
MLNHQQVPLSPVWGHVLLVQWKVGGAEEWWNLKLAGQEGMP